MKQISVILSLAIAVFSFTAVNAQSTKNKTPKQVDAIYQCPMKCEGDKTYNKAGKCPKCNMNLTKVKAKNSTDNHKGHDHN